MITVAGPAASIPKLCDQAGVLNDHDYLHSFSEML